MWDARELTQRIKALGSSVAKDEPASDIITQINTIKKEVVPTEEILRTTKAGIILGKLRSNPNKDISRAASEVVQRWKKAVEQEKSARASKASTSPAPKPASPAPKPISGAKKPFVGDAEKRTYVSDAVDISRTGSKVRDSCLGLIYNGLAYRSMEPIAEIMIRAIEVEGAAYKAFSGESKEYKDKIRSLFQNLKHKNNQALGQNVMAGQISPERFVRMTGKELMSAEMRKQELAIEAENMLKAQVPKAEKSISESFQCSACKQKKVSYTQAQTRSADEPMTTFCECLNCGKRWKFS